MTDVSAGLIIPRLNAILQDFIDEGPWYLGLHVAAFNRNGLDGEEVAVPEYSRQQVLLDAPGEGLTKNTNEIAFPAPITVGGYGVIVQGGLYSDPSPLVADTPQALLGIPAGSFSMPVGYNKTLPPAYLTLEFRHLILS